MRRYRICQCVRVEREKRVDVVGHDDERVWDQFMAKMYGLVPMPHRRLADW